MLLRGGGTIVRCLCKSIQLAGENYLNEVVKEILTKFISPSKNYEIDPEHLQAGDSLENNLVNVKEAVLVILAYVRSSIPRLPPFVLLSKFFQKILLFFSYFFQIFFKFFSNYFSIIFLIFFIFFQFLE